MEEWERHKGQNRSTNQNLSTVTQILEFKDETETVQNLHEISNDWRVENLH